MRLYIDGQLQESRPAAEYCTRLSHLPFMLGADPINFASGELAEGFLCGTMRAARISRGIEYSDSFTAPEHLDRSRETIALYDFTRDIGRYAIDLSGHNNHGVIIGARFLPTNP